jgi:hypothetical protein
MKRLQKILILLIIIFFYFSFFSIPIYAFTAMEKRHPGKLKGLGIKENKRLEGEKSKGPLFYYSPRGDFKNSGKGKANIGSGSGDFKKYNYQQKEKIRYLRHNS